MIQGKKIIALIPARGGSKGIPGKNLVKICGKSLVEHAIALAFESHCIDEIYVSTDDINIYNIAKSYNCATPQLRPKHLATDEARTIDVARNLINEGIIDKNSCILLLQPTSPVRNIFHLKEIVLNFQIDFENTNAIISVCEIDGPNPYKAQLIVNNYLTSLLRQDSTVPRQKLPKTYLPNGAFYLIKTSALLNENTFQPELSIPYIMNQLESINLDSKLDLQLLRNVVEKKIVTFDNHGALVHEELLVEYSQ